MRSVARSELNLYEIVAAQSPLQVQLLHRLLVSPQHGQSFSRGLICKCFAANRKSFEAQLRF